MNKRITIEMDEDTAREILHCLRRHADHLYTKRQTQTRDYVDAEAAAANMSDALYCANVETV